MCIFVPILTMSLNLHVYNNGFSTSFKTTQHRYIYNRNIYNAYRIMCLIYTAVFRTWVTDIFKCSGPN